MTPLETPPLTDASSSAIREPNPHSPKELLGLFKLILGPESSYFALAIVFGIGISILTLGLPLSVQMLIDTVANTGLVGPVIVLASVLFALMLISGTLNAFRTHLMEMFGRRIYARLVSEFSLRAVYAEPAFFEEVKRDSLLHRYYDIMTLQRNIPEILIGGFSIVFQALIGFTVVSLYHPVFLAFNLALILLLFLTWQFWGPSAIRTGLDLSRAKYETGKWLDHLGETNGFYKSERHIDYALNRSEDLIATYIDRKERHFSRTFAQTISLLLIAALAAGLLLGLGGWLVLQGQLTLGQLVAAELIMSAIFVGLAQFDTYLKMAYQVAMAVEEIGLVYSIPQERTEGRTPSTGTSLTLAFEDVHCWLRGRELSMSLAIPGGARVLARASDNLLEWAVSNLLKRNILPTRGWITIGGADLLELDAHQLRQMVMVIDRPTLIECTVEEFLSLSGTGISRGKMFEVLRLVGLETAIRELPDKMQTTLTPRGRPLSQQETMRLKLAAALLADPKVLVLGSAFDLLDPASLARVLSEIAQRKQVTLIQFSARERLPQITHHIDLDWNRQGLRAVENLTEPGETA